MLCCANCFGDIGLRDILPSHSSKRGKCDYCGSDDMDLVEPAKLFDLFSTVTNIYAESEDGQELVHWFREDWAMFQHSRMDDFRAKGLLAEILNDAEALRRRYRPSDRFKSNRLERWKQLSEELRSRNEKRAKVGDALRGGISWRCRVAVNSLPRKGYATCQRLPSPSCPIHRDLAPTHSPTSSAMGRAS